MPQQRDKIKKMQPEAKAEIFKIVQCCAVELSPRTEDLKFQAEIQVIVVIKNTEPIESLQDHRKNGKYGEESPWWLTEMCVFINTMIRNSQNVFICPISSLYFPVIHEDHHIPFIESGTANVPGVFSSPDV